MLFYHYAARLAISLFRTTSFRHTLSRLPSFDWPSWLPSALSYHLVDRRVSLLTTSSSMYNNICFFFLSVLSHDQGKYEQCPVTSWARATWKLGTIVNPSMHSAPSNMMSFHAYHVIVELLGYHWTLDIKVGLGISRTNADSQRNPVDRKSVV